MAAGSTVVLGVLTNDADPDGDALTITSSSAPTRGTVDCTSGSSCAYTAPAAPGPDSFTYTVSDGTGRSATATVAISVRATTPPDAADDAVTLGVGATANLFVLDNDADPDGGRLTIVSWTDPAAGGTVDCSTGVWCRYTAPEEPAADSFTYTVREPDGGTDTATVTVTVVEATGGNTSPFQCIDYPGFSTTAGLNLGADAAVVGEALRLTPAAYSQTGRVWTNGKLNVAGGFTTDFVFRFTQQGGIGAADGIAFVIQDISGTAVGGFGGGIGYHGLERSLAVEFDTYDNGSGNGDPDNNHVAVHSAGTGVNTTTLDTRLGVASLGTAVQLSDGNVHRARIVYAATGLLTVYLDDMATPKLSVPVDVDSLLGLVGGNAWVGFTSATGSGFENHDVLNWTLCPDAAGIDLSVTKVGTPNPVQVGSPLTYTITVHNVGDADATGVVVTDVLPAGVTLASASPGCDEVAGTVTCDVGTVGAGDDVAREIVVTPTTANPALVNTAAVDASTDPTPADNSATATVVVVGGGNHDPRAVADACDDTRGHAGHDPRADQRQRRRRRHPLGHRVRPRRPGHVLVHRHELRVHAGCRTPTAPTRSRTRRATAAAEPPRRRSR